MRLRVVVVCTPLPRLLLNSAVSCNSLPAKRLTSVDFPAPEEPIRDIVKYGLRYVLNISSESGWLEQPPADTRSAAQLEPKGRFHRL